MKNKIIKLFKKIGLYKVYKIPETVIQNFIELDAIKYSCLKKIITNYCDPTSFASDKNRLADINALLTERLFKFRKGHIPFLIETIGLKNKHILEIGCGTGSSTLALAEQGAIVTGIDINEEALNIAKKRLELYGLNQSFHNINAINIEEVYGNQKWDIIIFYASLEHMTPQERTKSLKSAYSLLGKGGHLCIFGTPNRLWPFDLHTSQMPFYMWLQDEIAIDYAQFSPRLEFAKIQKNNLNNINDELYRWGRGVSFHEIDLALNKVSDLIVVGSLPIFLRRYGFLQKISYRRSLEYKYKKILSKFGPQNIHPGFYECYLDIIIEKS